MNKIRFAVIALLALSLPSLLRADETAAKDKTELVTTAESGPVKGSKGKPALDFKVGTELWIEGNSPLTRFYFTATHVSATSEVDKSGPGDKGLLSLILHNKIHNLTVTVPVEGLKNGTAGMEKDAYESMKAKDFPEIVFKLNDYTIKPFPGNSKDYAIIAQGKLKIAGQERDIVLDATLVNDTDGLLLYGNQDILQKDYGINPHSVAGMPLISVENKIVVHYVVKLGMKDEKN
jgi:hypothetical protein